VTHATRTHIPKVKKDLPGTEDHSFPPSRHGDFSFPIQLQSLWVLRIANSLQRRGYVERGKKKKKKKRWIWLV